MSSFLLMPLLQAGLSIVLIPIVLRKHLKSPVHRLFSLYLLALTFWGLLIYLMRSSPTIEEAYSWEKTIILLAPLASVLFCHFSVRLSDIEINRWLIPSAYVVCILFASISRTNMVISGMRMATDGYSANPGPLMPVFGLFGYVMLILAFVILLKLARSSLSPEIRNRTTYIIIGLSISMLGGLMDVITIFGIAIFRGAVIGNMIFCLLTTIAIVRHNLLDINIVIRKGFAYLTVSAIVTVIYVGIIVLIYNIAQQTIPIWANIILLLILTLALRPLWVKIQDKVTRWFYRGRYDILEALHNFSRETHDITDLHQISHSLVNLIEYALVSSGVYLFLPTKSGDYRLISSTHETELSLDIRNPLVVWMTHKEGLLEYQDLSIIPQLEPLTLKEREELKRINARLFIPVKTKQGEVIAIILLSEKLSGQEYSENDKDLLLTVASQIATELENARLYNLEKSMRAELEEQDKQKTEFLHNIAHELKTPLTSVISSSELLSTQLPRINPEQVERLSRNINRSASSMNRRVTELLTYARMEIGKLKLELEPLDPVSFCMNVASQFAFLFQERNQIFELSLPDSLPTISADIERIEEIMMNLLTNAAKYSPIGGKISLCSDICENNIVFKVEDSAKQISEEEKEKLFQPYYRGENDSESSQVPGIGLGLSICRKLVELHDGKIWIENNGKKGNIFCFSLPVDRQQKGDTE